MSVTAAKGFRAAGRAAGLKACGGPDVALVVNDGPLDAAAVVFTSNRCKANPVLWSERAAAVCSAGLIGPQLNLDLLLAGVGAADRLLATDGGDDAALAIMTTDTVPKKVVHTSPAGWTIGGMAKGAGMLAPALATMLVVITTDTEVDAASCDLALRAGTRVSFDRLDSDGCQSTNDTVALLASGAGGVVPDAAEFAAAVAQVCLDLAHQLVADAEGADHEISIEVRNAASEDDAVEVGRSVARSNLFKAAVFGRGANWGRVLPAVATTRAAFDPVDLDVAMNDVWICRKGGPGESADSIDLSGRKVAVTIDLKSGDATATVWTNDLTHAYPHENSAYSS